jgi:uncharacterized protein (TIGR02646 family)
MTQRQQHGSNNVALLRAAEMRSVIKGPTPLDETGTPIVFSHYQEAAPHLKKRLGRYCSYCERTIPVGLAVEHKLPKEHNTQLELEWDNFLLACMNCNSSKGQFNPTTDSVVWPDEHDTFSLISYFPSGAVRPKLGITPEVGARVAFTLSLLGLSKQPAELASADHRLFDRLEVWRLASQSKDDLIRRDVPELRRAIVETCRATGGYSIWQAVFSDAPAMREAISKSFVGTKSQAAT